MRLFSWWSSMRARPPATAKLVSRFPAIYRERPVGLSVDSNRLLTRAARMLLSPVELAAAQPAETRATPFDLASEKRPAPDSKADDILQRHQPPVSAIVRI